jgi:hypothetical protein
MSMPPGPPPGPYGPPTGRTPTPGKKAWPQRHPIWSVIIAIFVLFVIIGIATNGTRPTSGSSPAARPSPPATGAAAIPRTSTLACEAQAVSNQPADHTIVKVRVRTVARARVTATGPLALARGQAAVSRASAQGTRTLRFRVGDASPGVEVVITVHVSQGGSAGQCRAWLMPRPAPATVVQASAPTTSPPASAPAPPPTTAASCYPLSNEGTCYEPGEFCRDSDHGMTGVAGDRDLVERQLAGGGNRTNLRVPVPCPIGRSTAVLHGGSWRLAYMP